MININNLNVSIIRIEKKVEVREGEVLNVFMSKNFLNEKTEISRAKNNPIWSGSLVLLELENISYNFVGDLLYISETQGERIIKIASKMGNTCKTHAIAYGEKLYVK